MAFANAAQWDQFWVHHFSQGYFNMQPGNLGIKPSTSHLVDDPNPYYIG